MKDEITLFKMKHAWHIIFCLSSVFELANSITSDWTTLIRVLITTSHNKIGFIQVWWRSFSVDKWKRIYHDIMLLRFRASNNQKCYSINKFWAGGKIAILSRNWTTMDNRRDCIYKRARIFSRDSSSKEEWLRGAPATTTIRMNFIKLLQTI